MLARGARIKKRVDLSLEHAVLDGVEQLFGFSQCQAQMLDAFVVLFQGNDIGDGCVLRIGWAYKQATDWHNRIPAGWRD